MTRPRLFHFNAWFDFALAGAVTGEHRRAVNELAALLLPVGNGGDRVLVSVELAEGHEEYLWRNGLEGARVCPYATPCEGFEGAPWGWDDEAVALLERHGARCDGPAPAVVEKVNARDFCRRLPAAEEFGVPGARSCESVAEVIQAVRACAATPLVIKPPFGSSGYGFIRKDDRCLTEGELRRVRRALGRGKVVVEPWLERLQDLSSRFTVGRDGSVTAPGHHRTHASRAGAFFADLLVPDDPVLAPWRSRLDEAAMAAGAALGRAGYFGPAGTDSFVYRDRRGDRRLAATIEINARMPMSTVAYALRERLGPDRVLYFRFIGRRRHRLPETYAALTQRLGPLAFDRARRRGVVLLTPLRVRHAEEAWHRPARSAFVVVGETESEVLALDERLRRAVSR